MEHYNNAVIHHLYDTEATADKNMALVYMSYPCNYLICVLNNRIAICCFIGSKYQVEIHIARFFAINLRTFPNHAHLPRRLISQINLPGYHRCTCKSCIYYLISLNFNQQYFGSAVRRLLETCASFFQTGQCRNTNLILHSAAGRQPLQLILLHARHCFHS